ncbi:hypothetical protein JOC86_004098 [Bacillus pakistanensis]|uniref:Uncharacterized protein n=1 Tax=Rossellomorea pakistanensis TaxID=992288 RepID=A0ABS2NI71_9BACI|nr:hypothetical protein [Bacillus pakistanensis]MBM7587525.1 hypothetical protein [Bacillus pakistanensis]
MKLLVLSFVLPIFLVIIVSWFTGNKNFFGGPNDDERKRTIKQKSVAQSWTTLLIFLVVNFLHDFFKLGDERLAAISLPYPELLYLMILVVSYFIFLTINNKKMSA